MKNYNITVLGSRGSGKTVLLACMHDVLSIQSEELGFSLQVPYKNKRQELNSYFDSIADTTRDWPPGTRELTEWKFECQVQIKLKKYTCCSFTYIDYPGGEMKKNASPELESKIKNSDVLIGLLDGQKILALMKGEQDVAGIWINKYRSEFFGDIKEILQDMQSIEIKEDDPPSIHFVITKWDLLKEKFTLEQVRNKLIEIKQFKNFVQLSVNANQVVRLIPVSAVGFNFAKLQADGTIKKIPILNSNPEPYQMEMPLACIFADKLKAEYRKNVEKETKRIEDNEIEIQKRKQQGIDYTGGEIVSQLAVDAFGGWVKGVPLLGKLISDQTNAVQRKGEEYSQAIKSLEREINASFTRVTDAKTALEFVEKKLVSLQTELDRRYPASLLKL